MANLSENTREYRQELLNLCISAFKEAINIDISFKEISLNFDIIGTYNNLGLAYYQLVIDGYLNGDKKSIAANLKSSLINHLQALKELQDQPESYKTTLNHIIKIVRTFYDELGIQGQNLALSQIPSQLIPEVLSRL